MLQSWQGDVLAVIAGVLMPYAFAPFHLPLLALISVMLLMLTWSGVSSRRAFFRGWIYGLAMFGIGVSWIHISINQFGGIDISLAIALTTIFVMFYSLFPAITGFFARRFSSSGKHQLAREYLLIIPAFWVLFEWIKGLLFTGFPWLTIGYSQIDMPISGFAPLFGVYSISFALVLSAGLLVYWILSGMSAAKTVLPTLCLLWIIPGFFKTIAWSEPTNEPFTVSMIQGNIAQDKKWLPQQRKPTMDLYTRLSRENWSSDLVIWPETAIPALYHQVVPFLKNLAQEARMNSSELLVGLPVYNKREDEYFNAMLSLGLAESFYEKKHLVPFGEYLPLKEWLGGIVTFLEIPMSNFVSGRQEKPLLTLVGQKVGISICYEDVFGEEVIDALPEATLLINASNDAWFGDSVAAPQHLQIARMRSLETARYLLRSTNTGVSAIINDKGDIEAKSPQFEVDVLTGEIQPMKGMTPYAVFTNIPIVLLILIMIITAYVLGRKYKEVNET